MLSFIFLIVQRHPRSTLFPYTTLFRSRRSRERVDVLVQLRAEREGGRDLQTTHCPEHGPPTGVAGSGSFAGRARPRDRKSTRLNSSHSQISYAVFCLKKKEHPRFLAGT